MAFQREVAHRAFALEFNGSRHEIKGAGEKDPSFLVTPLGAKVNRLHIVGVCTDVEPVGESGEVYRARVSDPTGVFTVYAGQYQPEAAQALSQLQPPCYVAITGKARAYEPEPGSMFVSIRPESVNVVDEATRDQWVLGTARLTQERLEAVRAARASPAAPAEELARTGIRKPVAEGAVIAREQYATSDLQRYAESVAMSAGYLVEGGAQIPVHRAAAAPAMEAPQPAEPTPAWKAPAAPPVPAKDEAADALDAQVVAAVERLQGQKGARWDDIVQETAKAGVSVDDVEESLNRLMDKGLVYEPTLGILKTT